MLQKTKAIILTTHDFGDTSLICNLFSQEYGKLSIIAKGARSIKNPNKALLQPMHNIDLEYYYKPKRKIQILKEVSINNHFYNLKKNLKKLTHAYLALDIINHIAQTDNPCEIIFRLINKFLEKINDCETRDIKLYFIFFQLQLLKFLGFAPNLEYCFHCEKKLLTSLYDIKGGVLCCNNCLVSTTEFLRLDNKVMHEMHMLNKTHIDRLNQNNLIEKTTLQSIQHYLDNAINYSICNIKNLKSYQFTL